MFLFNKIASKQQSKDASHSNNEVSERPLRSIVKALCWRLIGTVDTLLVSYFLTGEIKLAGAIAAIDFLTKMALYFFHERAWNKISWGR